MIGAMFSEKTGCQMDGEVAEWLLQPARIIINNRELKLLIFILIYSMIQPIGVVSFTVEVRPMDASLIASSRS